MEDGATAPTFLVGALKDPLSGNLDRLQIIKGWLDAAGVTHEKIFNVAWGDAHKRKLSRDGTLPPVGNTVNPVDAGWTNTIGDAELVGVWQDPEFSPSQPAVYYVRLENRCPNQADPRGAQMRGGRGKTLTRTVRNSYKTTGYKVIWRSGRDSNPRPPA